MVRIIWVKLIFLVMLLAKIDCYAQDDKKDENTTEVDSTVNGKLKFTPYIAPAYSNETNLMLSCGGLLSFKLKKSDQALKRSSMPFSAGYSLNKSFQFNVRYDLYAERNKLRFNGEFWIKDMPDHYWGVGFSENYNTVKSDSTTKYHRYWWRFYGKITHQIRPNFFAGPIIDVSKTIATELNPKMSEDPYIIKYGKRTRNTGIGLDLAYDSRDFVTNAYKGMYLDLSMLFYRKLLGGESDFNVIEFDYRHFRNMGKPRRTLAWQIKSRTCIGEAPWSELSQLGNPFDFRGYIWGHYRDVSLLLGVIEYRHMFEEKNPDRKNRFLSHSGFVTWAGIGSTGNSFGEYYRWLPTIGLGYRFEIQERMNLRIDFGLGMKSNAFYISFNEAF